MAIQTDNKGANKLTNTKMLAPWLTYAHDINVIQIQKQQVYTNQKFQSSMIH